MLGQDALYFLAHTIRASLIEFDMDVEITYGSIENVSSYDITYPLVGFF